MMRSDFSLNILTTSQGDGMSKRLVGGIKGCKYKTSSWHLNRFPDADNIVVVVVVVSYDRSSLTIRLD